MDYENLSDPKGEAAEAYALLGMPTSFVVGSEGRVTSVHAGRRRGDMKAIRAHILELIGERSLAVVRVDG